MKSKINNRKPFTVVWDGGFFTKINEAIVMFKVKRHNGTARITYWARTLISTNPYQGYRPKVKKIAPRMYLYDSVLRRKRKQVFTYDDEGIGTY